MRKFWLLALPILALACQQETTYKTASGIEVTKILEGTGEAPIKDSIIVLKLKIATDSGTILTETTTERPLALAYDPEMEAGSLQEVLNTLKKGDSVSFSVTAQNLFEKTYNRPVPPDMDSTELLSCNMKFEDQMSQEAYRAYMTELREKMMAKEQEMMAEKIITDGDSIDTYLAEEGIEAITSDSGLRYVITKEGTGPMPEPGDQVTVHYEGKLFKGDYFDTSVEEVAKAQGLFNPQRDYSGFTFPLGQGRVIKGWDEGIGYIKEGGKGTLYIPSPLGYGSRGSGPKIPPYSILVFDVEVLKVEKMNQ